LKEIEIRIAEIYARFIEVIISVTPVQIDKGFLRIIIRLKDKSTLRVVEEWEGGKLESYSYYWLDKDNRLISGWDNVPHHKKLENFPHHKHISEQKNILPSQETCLEDVMRIIIGKLKID